MATMAVVTPGKRTAAANPAEASLATQPRTPAPDSVRVRLTFDPLLVAALPEVRMSKSWLLVNR